MKFIYYIFTFVLCALVIISCKKKDSTPAPAKPTIQPVIGINYAGGIVFYIDSTEKHGLVAATADLDSSIEWGCTGVLDTATGTATGTGAQNTTAIVKGCDSSNCAALLCRHLAFSGYNDWFLPSKDELNLMFTNLCKDTIGNFAPTFYWSSTEQNAGNAWFQFFGNGFQSSSGKSYKFEVRAVRAF